MPGEGRREQGTKQWGVKRPTSPGQTGPLFAAPVRAGPPPDWGTPPKPAHKVDGAAGLGLWRSSAACGRGVAVGHGIHRPEGKNDGNGGKGGGVLS